MVREKGKMRKTAKVLVRMNDDEKAQAEKLSKAEGRNTSEFIRKLITDYAAGKTLVSIHARLEKISEKMLAMLDKK